MHVYTRESVCQEQYINGNIFFLISCTLQLQVSKSPGARNPGLMAWTMTTAATAAATVAAVSITAVVRTART